MIDKSCDPLWRRRPLAHRAMHVMAPADPQVSGSDLSRRCASAHAGGLIGDEVGRVVRVAGQSLKRRNERIAVRDFPCKLRPQRRKAGIQNHCRSGSRMVRFQARG